MFLQVYDQKDENILKKYQKMANMQYKPTKQQIQKYVCFYLLL